MSQSLKPLPALKNSLSIARNTLLCSSMAVILSACGGSEGTDSNVSNTPNQPSDPTPPINPDLPDPPETPDVPETDSNWLPTGGSATISADIPRPFLQIIPNLPSSALSGVSTGRELFIAEWTPANQGRVLFDGVGPLFNAHACTQCHSAEGRKPTYAANGELSDII